ncbi:hypothetical protein Bca4012_098088 [Brassica carinata]
MTSPPSKTPETVSRRSSAIEDAIDNITMIFHRLTLDSQNQNWLICESVFFYQSRDMAKLVKGILCMPLDFNHNSATKILVEVELSKGFPSRIAANDENGFIAMVDVDYAWLPSKCERCGQLRQKIKHCLESVIKFHIVATDVSENPSNGSTVVVEANKLPKSVQPDTSLVQTSAVTVSPPSNESSVVDIAILENQLCGTLSAIPVFMNNVDSVD